MSPQLFKENLKGRWYQIVNTGLLTGILGFAAWGTKEVYALGQASQVFMQVKDLSEKTESKVEGLKEVVHGLLVVEGRQDAQIEAMKEQVNRLLNEKQK